MNHVTNSITNNEELYYTVLQNVLLLSVGCSILKTLVSSISSFTTLNSLGFPKDITSVRETSLEMVIFSSDVVSKLGFPFNTFHVRFILFVKKLFSSEK